MPLHCCWWPCCHSRRRERHDLLQLGGAGAWQSAIAKKILKFHDICACMSHARSELAYHVLPISCRAKITASSPTVHWHHIWKFPALVARTGKTTLSTSCTDTEGTREWLSPMTMCFSLNIVLTLFMNANVGRYFMNLWLWGKAN